MTRSCGTGGRLSARLASTLVRNQRSYASACSVLSNSDSIGESLPIPCYSGIRQSVARGGSVDGVHTLGPAARHSSDADVHPRLRLLEPERPRARQPGPGENGARHGAAALQLVVGAAALERGQEPFQPPVAPPPEQPYEARGRVLHPPQRWAR